MNRVEQAQHTAINVADGVGVSIVIAAIIEWVPPVTAVLTLIWAALRIYQICLDIKEKKNRPRNDT